MALKVRCPNGHTLQISSQHLGKEVHCPRCRVLMVIEAPPEPQQPEKAETFAIQEDFLIAVAGPDPQGRDEEKTGGISKAQRMRLARLGLAFHYGKIVCLLMALLSMIATLLVVRVAADAQFAGDVLLKIAAVIAIVFGVASLVFLGIVPLLSTVGSALCLGLPERTGAKWLAVASFALDALSLVLFAGSMLLGGTAAAVATSTGQSATKAGGGTASAIGGLADIAMLGSWLCAFGAWVLFMLAVHALLNYFRDSYIARETLGLLYKGIALSIATPVYSVLSFFIGGYAGAKGDPIAGQIITGLMLIMAVLVWALLLFKILAVVAGARGHLERWT
jgi:hypothetical protein